MEMKIARGVFGNTPVDHVDLPTELGNIETSWTAERHEFSSVGGSRAESFGSTTAERKVTHLFRLGCARSEGRPLAIRRHRPPGASPQCRVSAARPLPAA